MPGVSRFSDGLVQRPEFDCTPWFLAIDGEQIAGTALCLPRTERLDWIRGLGVRRPWRGRGLGMALLRHAFGVFYAFCWHTPKWEVWRAKPSKKRSFCCLFCQLRWQNKQQKFYSRGPQAPAAPAGELASSIFYARGYRSAGLGVDAQSLTGATRLYERAGMRMTERYDVLEKNTTRIAKAPRGSNDPHGAFAAPV